MRSVKNTPSIPDGRKYIDEDGELIREVAHAWCYSYI